MLVVLIKFVRLIKFWEHILYCIPHIILSLVYLNLFHLCLLFVYVHRNPNWSRETCNSFLWISSVVKLLKHMLHHLPHSKCVWFMICIWICCYLKILILLYITPEQKSSQHHLHYIRFPVMRIHQFLYLLQQKVLMRGRWHQSYMSLNLVPSQVLVCKPHVYICFSFSYLDSVHLYMSKPHVRHSPVYAKLVLLLTYFPLSCIEHCSIVNTGYRGVLWSFTHTHTEGGGGRSTHL